MICLIKSLSLHNNYLKTHFVLQHKFTIAVFAHNLLLVFGVAALQSVLQFKNSLTIKKVETDHIAVRTSSYYGIGKQSKTIKVHGLHYIIENANADDGLLIVDDVFDSGRSVVALTEKLNEVMRLNMPRDVRIATPYYKPKNKAVSIVPDYYIHESDEWLVFPHEVSGLSPKEITEGKSDLKNIAHLFTRED